MDNKYYTVKQIADACNTYKKRIERYIESHEIKESYRDGAHNTKYYDENVYKQIMLDLGSNAFVKADTAKSLIESQNVIQNELAEKNKQIDRLMKLLETEQAHNKELENQAKLIESAKNEEIGAIRDELEALLKESNKNMTEAQKSLESTKNSEIEHVKHIQELENTINELKEENRNLKQQTRHEPKKRWFQFWK